MKMMEDYVRDTLRGEVETITVTELRAHPGECLTQTSLGKSFCIKRKGKIVGFLVPPGDADVVHVVHPDGSVPTLGVAARGSEPPRQIQPGAK